MPWQFGKNENPDAWRVERLQLVAQPSLDELLRAKQERRARVKGAQAARMLVSIRKYISTCEQGITLEQVAEAMQTDCKKVRAVVQQMKAAGVLIEATHHSHCLIRVAKVTP